MNLLNVPKYAVDDKERLLHGGFVCRFIAAAARRPPLRHGTAHLRRAALLLEAHSQQNPPLDAPPT